MTNPLTDEQIDRAVNVFFDSELSHVGSKINGDERHRIAMRAAAKVIESALAGDRPDVLTLNGYTFGMFDGRVGIKANCCGLTSYLDGPKMHTWSCECTCTAKAVIKGKSHE